MTWKTTLGVAAGIGVVGAILFTVIRKCHYRNRFLTETPDHVHFINECDELDEFFGEEPTFGFKE